MLWQDHLLQPSDLEIIFGKDFPTHQITLEELERICGLDFGPLTSADTYGLPENMREQNLREAASEAAYSDRSQSTLPLSSLDDIVLGSKTLTEQQ